jgi:hypothetical protein
MHFRYARWQRRAKFVLHEAPHDTCKVAATKAFSSQRACLQAWAGLTDALIRKGNLVSKRLLNLSASLAVVVGMTAVLANCELITQIDRTLIPSEGTGGTAAAGGSSTTTGMGGAGGGGTTCTDASDCGTDTDCQTFSCDSGTCSTNNVAQGTACDDDSGELCDGSGSCVAANCMDGVMNGDETAVDCGGSCSGCGTGAACDGDADCTSGFCDDGSGAGGSGGIGGAGGSGGTTGGGPGVCKPCSVDADCSSMQFCSAGTCTGTGALGDACSASNQCQSGNCSDGLCCDSACGGGCDACSVAAGADTDGTCKILAAASAGSPSCAPFLCDGSSGACPTSCSADGECVGVCSTVDNVCCDTNCTGLCESCTVAGFEGTCTAIPAGTDPDSECVNGTCDGSGACDSLKNNGDSCTMNGECVSGFCADDVCCDTACGGNCEACDLGGTVGTCVAVTNGDDADTCMGTNTCDASGACLAVNGQGCSMDTECASGSCADTFCCDTACNGNCESCAAASNGGANGTCGNVTDGLDPRNDCTDPEVCDGAGACGRPIGEGCSNDGQCNSGNCADGFCCNTACDGLCVRCNGTNTVGGNAGTCEFINAGDEDGGGSGECSGGQTCDGAGMCM